MVNASDAGGEEWRAMDRGAVAYRPGADAEVVAAARARIPELRQSPVELRFVGRDGRPLRGLAVRLEQRRHAFPFGEQLWGLDTMAREGEWDSGRARAWRRRYAEVFNAANNLCYWTERPRHDASKTEDEQGDWRIENFARTVDWSLAQGLTAKGHPLFWSIPKAVPDWVQRYDRETFLKFAEVRVRNLVARFKGRVTLWDAVNEPMWEACPWNLARRHWPHLEAIPEIADYVADILRWARAEDPGATFLVNDYGMELDKAGGEALRGPDGTPVTAARQRARYRALVEELRRRGAAPDALGLQAHSGWIRPGFQQALLDEMAGAGLPLHITEFWANTAEFAEAGSFSADEVRELQLRYIVDYVTVAFGHPAIEAFFFWGAFKDMVQWGERSGHDLLPLFHALRRLFHETWATRAEAVADDDGVVRLRAFHGLHEASFALPGGNQRTALPFTVSKQARNFLELRSVHH